MFWKFNELNKFRKTEKIVNKQIDRDNSIKEQWFEFLCICSEQTETPDRNQLILDAYRILNMIKWRLYEINKYKQQVLMLNRKKFRREKELRN